MEELRVSRLLAGGLAAVSGAVVASRIRVEGTLTGAALTSIFVAVATALYCHSLTLTPRTDATPAGPQGGWRRRHRPAGCPADPVAAGRGGGGGRLSNRGWGHHGGL